VVCTTCNDGTYTSQNCFTNAMTLWNFLVLPLTLIVFSTIACLFVLSALVQFGKIVFVWVLSFVVGASLVIFVIDRRRLSTVVPFPLWVACQTVLHHSLCGQQDFSCSHARCERA